MRTPRSAAPPRRFRSTALLCAALAALLAPGDARAGLAFPVVIDNGTIALGLDIYGCLNVNLPIGPEGKGADIGLYDLGTGLDGTRGGIPYEGWGIADLDFPAGGGAISLVAPSGGTQNLVLDTWNVSGAGTLPISSGDRLTVSHMFPSAGSARNPSCGG
jgi:hypothetical protein